MYRALLAPLVALFFIPAFAHAAISLTLTPIIPLGQCAGTAPDWGSVMAIFQIGINDLVAVATILITIYIAWAGFAFMLAPINPEAKTKARTRIVNAVLGLLVALGAWLLVNTLMATIYSTAFDNGVSWNQILADGGDQCIVTRANPPSLPGIVNNTLSGTNNTVGAPANNGGIPPSASSTNASGAAGSDKLNTQAAVNWLNSNVQTTTSNHACLSSVRQALAAGGVTLQCATGPGGTAPWAGLCNGPLQSAGFSSLGGGDPSPQAGDIVVVQHPSGTPPIGHIAMYTGSAWVSDFIQSNSETPPGNPYGSAGTQEQYWRP